MNFYWKSGQIKEYPIGAAVSGIVDKNRERPISVSFTRKELIYLSSIQREYIKAIGNLLRKDPED